MGIDEIWSYKYEPDKDLSQHHLEQLQDESGLRDEILKTARPFSLRGRFVMENGLKTDILIRLSLPESYKSDLLIFPYPDKGNSFRARLDVPERKDGKDIRYKQPRKQRNVPYVITPENSKYVNTIFITEGEKKAMALAQAGCNAIGFGGVWNWRDRSSPTGVCPDFEAMNIRESTIAIVFDSDIALNPAVLKAEESLVDFCIARGASKVLRVRIPGGADHKTGIDDHLKVNGNSSLDELLTRSIIENGFITGLELLHAQLEQERMLTNFLPEGSFVLVAGVPGAGKTEFLIKQAADAATYGKVLYYLNEGGMLNLQTRLKAYCLDDSKLKDIHWEIKRFPDFRDSDGIAQFKLTLKTFSPKVIFIDPGPDAFGEENDAAQLKESLTELYQLTQKHNVCIVLSWHFSKITSFANVYSLRGSSAIPGKMDLVYNMDASKNNRYLKLDKLRLDCKGLRQGMKWIIDITETDTGKEMRFIDVQEATAARNERKQEKMTEALSKFTPGGEYTTTEIVQTLRSSFEGEVQESTASRYLKNWINEGVFEVLRKGIGKKPTVYKRTIRAA